MDIYTTKIEIISVKKGALMTMNVTAYIEDK